MKFPTAACTIVALFLVSANVHATLEEQLRLITEHLVLDGEGNLPSGGM